jgi:Co/Zn/Cd efflux system component
MSTDASAPVNANLLMQSESSSDSEQVESVPDAEQEEALLNIGALIQDLFHSVTAKVSAALDALICIISIREHSRRGRLSRALVQLILICLDKTIDLDKAIERIPACDQVPKLNELAELKTLRTPSFAHDGSPRNKKSSRRRSGSM